MSATGGETRRTADFADMTWVGINGPKKVMPKA
jgi:hypothetical protein